LRSAFVVGALFFGLSCSTVALAQESDADREGRTHFEAGRLHFERGAYEEALGEFQAAFELSGRVDLLYNLYLTTERLGDFDAAIGYLERYLAEGSPDAERRASLEPRLANLRERRDARAASPDANPPARGASSGGDLVPAAIAFGVAGAGLLSFAIFGGLALAEDDSLAALCGTSCSDAQLSTLGTLTLAADISWITAAVAAGVGAVLALTLGMPSESSGVTALAPWVLPSGGGVLAAGRL
jgi:tetratricopeptide (TPR) repeat protein